MCVCVGERERLCVRACVRALCSLPCRLGFIRLYFLIYFPSSDTVHLLYIPLQ